MVLPILDSRYEEDVDIFSANEDNPFDNLKMTLNKEEDDDQTRGDQLMHQNIEICKPDTTRVPTITTVEASPRAPSMESGEKKVSLRKPGVTAAVVRNTESCSVSGEHDKVAKLNDQNEVCTFKRGGMCMKHECVGQKYVVSSKVWTKNAKGMFGYKTVKQTKYRCRFRGVPVTNAGKPGPEVRIRTKVTSSLGEGVTNHAVGNTTLPEGCGRDYRGAGASKSESNAGQNDLQENG